VQDELTKRRDAGGSNNLSAASNEDLRLYFDEKRNEIGDRPEFSPIFDRYLSRDSLSPKTFADPGEFTLGFVQT